MRPDLRRERKSLAGQCYQLLTGHASIGPYLYDKIHVESNECWWCRSGERQSRFHLVARCRSGQKDVEKIGKACAYMEAPEGPIRQKDV